LDSLEVMEKELIHHKDELEFEEDFIALTVLCYLKVNTEKYMINPTKHSQMLNSCLLVNSIVITMLGTSLYGIFTNEGGFYTPFIPETHALWFVKFPCAIALHFCLTPHISCGMAIMKFANN
jgi:hypothetical protein